MARLIFRTLLTGVIFAAILFAPIRTFHWPRAWAFLALMALFTTISYSLLLPTRLDLLLERSRVRSQRGQPLADRLVLLMYKLSMGVVLVFISRDVFWYHLLPPPPLWVSGIGLVGFAAGWALVTMVWLQNPFAAVVVKNQSERDHRVITTGPHAIVRHPMYAALIPLFPGACLFLGSTAAALATLVPLAVLVFLRIPVEERFLRRTFPEYEEYMRRVRYRVIPGVW